MISVIIPTLNEEEGIGEALKKLDFIKKDQNNEIIIVDGYSKDRTVEIAKKHNVKIIMEARKGYGRAYKSGFEQAKGKFLVALDGDATYPAQMIPSFIKKMEDEKLDFITTNRFAKLEKGSMTLLNRVGNIALSLAMRLLFFCPFNDSQSGMWVIRKSRWDEISYLVKSDGMEFSEELKIDFWRKHNKFKCIEMPIPYEARLGKPKLNPWKDGIRNLVFLFKKRFS